ncbi:hypothetical protein VTK26DRAFT_7371 [Humicola hyalothermophila]
MEFQVWHLHPCVDKYLTYSVQGVARVRAHSPVLPAVCGVRYSSLHLRSVFRPPEQRDHARISVDLVAAYCPTAAGRQLATVFSFLQDGSPNLIPDTLVSSEIPEVPGLQTGNHRAEPPTVSAPAGKPEARSGVRRWKGSTNKVGRIGAPRLPPRHGTATRRQAARLTGVLTVVFRGLL